MNENRLQRIDVSNIFEHSRLEDSDLCYFLGEYTSGKGFEHSEMNQVINNFKKPIYRKTKPEWLYKDKAISKIAEWLMQLSAWDKLKQYTWVPIPTSKTKSDPEYDDSLLQILQKLKLSENTLDIRELLIRKTSRTASHIPGSKRPTVDELMADTYLNENITTPIPNAIVVFDDVITSGAHFKSAQRILQERYTKNIPIIGIFVARSIKISGDGD